MTPVFLWGYPHRHFHHFSPLSNFCIHSVCNVYRTIGLTTIFKRPFYIHLCYNDQMKQHITIEQLQGLTPKLRVKLNRTWRNNGQEVNLLNHKDINIGNMIEFLEENLPKDKDEFNTWMDLFFHYTNNDDGLYKSYDGELCDALWSAVKEVLEK